MFWDTLEIGQLLLEMSQELVSLGIDGWHPHSYIVLLVGESFQSTHAHQILHQ